MYISKYNEVVKPCKENNTNLKSNFTIFTIDGINIDLLGYYLGHVEDHRYHCYYDIEEDKVFTFSKEKIISVKQQFLEEQMINAIKFNFNKSEEPIIDELNIDVLGNFEVDPIINTKYDSFTENSNWLVFYNESATVYYFNRRNIVCFS